MALAQPADAPVQFNCSQNAERLSGNPGTTHTVRCPSNCTSSTIWGTDTYSDDSAVCTAAVHAGAISADSGGVIEVTIAPGEESYSSSTQNGVNSSEWGTWDRSFTVQASDSEPGIVQLSCTQNAQVLEGAPGTTHTVQCPTNCADATIWGTGTYSDDSTVCTAAIHAGVIDTTGGTVQVTIAEGEESYPSSTQNGVESSEWGSWDRSFTVSAPGDDGGDEPETDSDESESESSDGSDTEEEDSSGCSTANSSVPAPLLLLVALIGLAVARRGDSLRGHLAG